MAPVLTGATKTRTIARQNGQLSWQRRVHEATSVVEQLSWANSSNRECAGEVLKEFDFRFRNAIWTSEKTDTLFEEASLQTARNSRHPAVNQCLVAFPAWLYESIPRKLMDMGSLLGTVLRTMLQNGPLCPLPRVPSSGRGTCQTCNGLQP